MSDHAAGIGMSTVADVAAPGISARDREMFDRSPIGVVISDLDRRIHYANAEAMALLGVDRYEGHNLLDAFTDASARAVLDEQLGMRREGLIGSYRATLRRLSDGRPIEVAVTGVPLTDEQGRVTGTLGYFRSLETEALIEELHRLNGETEDGHKLMLDVAERLVAAFRADWVIVTRYSDNLGHASPFFVYRPGSKRRKVEWRKRWIALDAAQQEYTRTATTRVIDGLPEFMQAGVWRSVTDDPFVKAILEDGQQSALSRPIRRRRDVLGMVTLLSARRAAFSDDDRQLLDELPVDATVSQVLDAARHRQSRERFELLQELTRQVTAKQACEVLARRLVGIFGWSHVSVFRVDYAEARIQLLAQFAVPHEPLHLPEDYSQAIDLGLLGRVVRDRQTVNVGDVTDVTAAPDYIAAHSSNGVRSELCCPIHFERERTVRWIINVEDRSEDAFSENESVWLSEIAAEVGALMERISNLHFLTECFRSTSDPIVVTGPDHDIRKANPAAARLLGYADPKDVRGPFAALLQDAADFERVLAREGDVGEFLVRRRDPDEYPIPVHLSRQQLPEKLGGTIFVLKDLRAIRRMVELEFQGEVAYEVAAQTRAPLAMATTALERMRSSLAPDAAREVDKVLRLLGRVRQGYTRLALYHRESVPGVSAFAAINLGAELRAVVADFPDAEQPLVRVVEGGPPVMIQGDHFRIALILETLIAALVRCAPEEEPVTATVAFEGGRARVTLAGYQPAAAADDPAEARLGAALRADVRISRPLMQRFMTDHGGSLGERHGEDGRVQFTLDFPLAESGGG
jgi:PAS domain S-box-containing protein